MVSFSNLARNTSYITGGAFLGSGITSFHFAVVCFPLMDLARQRGPARHQEAHPLILPFLEGARILTEHFVMGLFAFSMVSIGTGFVFILAPTVAPKVTRVIQGLFKQSETTVHSIESGFLKA